MAAHNRPELSGEAKAAILRDIRSQKRRADQEMGAFYAMVRDGVRHGLTYKAVADEFGVSTSTAFNWNRRAAA